MKKKIVSLHGSYFGNNYGDTLLVNIFAQWIKDVLPDYTINLPLANKNITKDLPDGTVGMWNLVRSKCLVFCGGGYFGEQPMNKSRWAWRNFVRHGIIGLLAIFFRIPYAIIGVEFGPISSKWFRKICLMIARHSHVIVVRNIESKRFLESNGVKNVIQSVDAVLSLSEKVKPVDTNSNDILVHIPGNSNASQYFIKLIECLVRVLYDNKMSSRLLFINDSYDEIYYSNQYKDVFDFLERENIPYSILTYTGYRPLIKLINNERYIITTKLHVGITAAALNKRPLSIWQHPKTKRLHEQIGNAAYCCPLKEIAMYQDVIKDYLTEKSQYVLSNTIKEQALLNKEALFDFIHTVEKTK